MCGAPVFSPGLIEIEGTAILTSGSILEQTLLTINQPAGYRQSYSYFMFDLANVQGDASVTDLELQVYLEGISIEGFNVVWSNTQKPGIFLHGPIEPHTSIIITAQCTIAMALDQSIDYYYTYRLVKL